jgi:hypothetical protein
MSQGKTFKLHWGSGIVAEEAQTVSEYKLPTIQLLEFTDGFAKGRSQIRFCHYSPKGAFQRSPLIIDTEEIPELRQAIRACPKLHRLLEQLLR